MGHMNFYKTRPGLPPANRRILGRFLTQSQFCGWSGWGRTTIYRLVRDFVIPYRMISGRPVLDPYEVIGHIRKYNSIPVSGVGAPSRHPQGSEMGANGVFPFVRAREYARKKGFSVHALYRMLEARRVPHYKVSGTYFVDPSEIEFWMEACKVASLAEQIGD